MRSNGPDLLPAKRSESEPELGKPRALRRTQSMLEHEKHDPDDCGCFSMGTKSNLFASRRSPDESNGSVVSSDKPSTTTVQYSQK